MGVRTTARKSTAKERGRRPGNGDTRSAILDAGEACFAMFGYAGTGLRVIAAKAGVNQGLLHHYFGSKERLFQEVFLRRGSELARRRVELLDALEVQRKAPSVEDIVAAYLRPAYELKAEGGPGGVAFLKLQARLNDEMQMIPRAMRDAVYDEAMQRYIAAFAQALPKLDAKTVYWRMIFAVGAYLYTISDLHRLDAISDGACNPRNLDESFSQLASFVANGLRGKIPT